MMLGSPKDGASLLAQMVKNPPAMQETWVRSLSWKDPLEEGMVTHFCILAWGVPMDRGAWWATVHGVPRSRTGLSDYAQPQSFSLLCLENERSWASLVVQWFRIYLPMQETWVWSLVREDPTCFGATKPMHHSYWAHKPQLKRSPGSPQLEKAHMPQQRPNAAKTK